MKKAMVVFGTRPEAIKMAPVVRELLSEDSTYRPVVVVTGQHRELLHQALEMLEIEPDIDLSLMKPNQSLAEFASTALSSLSDVIKSENPDLILVHGDTSTSFIGALAAYYNQVPVGHVEAGLRTDSIKSPWPEEGNRRLIGRLTKFHFAPTSRSAENLLKENIDQNTIFVTGNTVVDSLLWVKNKLDTSPTFKEEFATRHPYIEVDEEIVLVTNHRRENFGDGMRNVYNAVKRLAVEYPLKQFIFPMHLNPNARRPAEEILSESANVHLIAPLDYQDFVYMLATASLIITDSGGVQEEAPSFGTHVLVTRQSTERPEGIEAGVAVLVGTDEDEIVEQANKILKKTTKRSPIDGILNPYGDGTAARQIIRALNDHSHGN